MSKAEDDALAASIKFGSGPIGPVRQGSVDFGDDKYGVSPLVVAEVDDKTEAAKADSSQKAESADKKES